MPRRCRSPRLPTSRRRRRTWSTRSASTIDPAQTQEGPGPLDINLVRSAPVDPMIAAKVTGWPSLQRGLARSPKRMRLGALAAGAIAVLAALLAIAPLTSLAVMAAGSTGDLWQHLIRYVVPVALLQTSLLLAGVAALTLLTRHGSLR